MGGNKPPSIRERPGSQRDWDFSGVAGGDRSSNGSGPGRKRQLWPPSRGMLIAGAVALATLVAAYAYDSSRKDLIRDGVRVAGVNVGGLRADAARVKLRRELAGRLERSIHVKAAGARFKLTRAKAGLTVDVDGMVDEAIARSRASVFPVRVVEDLAGTGSNANLPAEVNYSHVAVRRFARSVKLAVNRPPQNAQVNFAQGATAELPVVPSQTGLKINAGRVRSAVEGALAATGVERSVRPSVKVTQPDVTSKELAPKYPVVVTVDRTNFKLRLFKDLRLAKAYTIAVGQAGLETPAGLYHVTDKTVDPAWNVPDRPWAGDLAGTTIPGGAPDNPLKARWLGFFDGAGIHGTADVGSLGSAASHGCIRMSVPDVEALYPQVPLGAPVYVQ